MRAFLRVVLASVVASAVACSQPTEVPADTAPAERIAAIREARQVVGSPVSELTAATANAISAVALLREELPVEPARRRSLADAVDAEDLAALDSAADAVAEARTSLRPSATPATGDVTAASAALDGVVSAARETAATARLELERIRRIAEVDARLAGIVAAWDDGGSRSTLLARYSELTAEARALATELEDPITDPESGLVDQRDCDGARSRRQQAAAAAAEASAELRDLVARRRGNDLDARIEELVADPYGLGRPLVELDRQQADCWSDGEVADLRDRLAEALDDLEAALNPTDLSDPPTPTG